jgi:hypothetical protein
MKRESFHFLGLFARNFCSQGIYISAFAAIPFEICFSKTCKLEKEELCLYYA